MKKLNQKQWWLLFFALFLQSTLVYTQVKFTIEKLPDANTYQVSMLPEVTWESPFNITNSAQITIRVPAGGFVIGSVNSNIQDVVWDCNVHILSPDENPDFDYFSFAMTTMGTDKLSYVDGEEVALFTFQNTGTCTGPTIIIEEDDPFFPPNTQNANIGNLLLTLGAGNENAFKGVYNPFQAECSACIINYELELLEDDVIQVSLIPSISYPFPENATNTAQIVVKVPTGGFEVSNFNNLISGVDFEFTNHFFSPAENPEFDYLVFALQPGGTFGIDYEAGVKVPLFTFDNDGNCHPGIISLMQNEVDPFFPPNSMMANVQQQITLIGTGPDAYVCVEGEGVRLCQNFEPAQVDLILPPNAPFDTCLTEFLPQVSQDFSSINICASNPNEVVVTPDLAGCVSLDPEDGFSGNTQVCMEYCNDATPPLCDTVFLNIQVLSCTASHPIYTQTSLTIPTVPAVSCSDGTDTVFIDATASNGSGVYSFQWEGPDFFAANTEDIQLPNITEDMSGTYTLNAIDSYGCPAIPASVEVNVFDELPVPIIQIAGGTCVGNTIILSAINIAGNGVDYEWQIPATAINIVDVNSNQLIISDLDPSLHDGTYSLNVTGNNCPNDQSSAPIFITVGEQPVIDPSVTVSGTGCASSIELFANGENPNDLDYNWTGPFNFNSSEMNPIIDPAGAAQNGIYILEVWNEFNCLVTDSVEVSGLSNELSQPIITGTPSACVGETIILSVESYSGIEIEYVWTRDNIILEGENSNQLILQPLSDANSGVYQLLVNVDGCFSASNLYEVEVLSLPEIAPTFELSEPCEGGTLQLLTNITSPNDNAIFEWTGPNNFSSFSPNPLIFNTVFLQNGTYTVLVTSENGCQTSASILIDEIVETPEQPIVGDIDPVCEEGTILLTVINAVSGGTYFWYNADGVQIGTDNFLEIQANDPLAIQPFIASIFIEDCEEINSAPVFVDIQNIQAPTLSTPNNTLCAGNTIQLNSTQMPGNQVTYQWYFETDGMFTLLASTVSSSYFINNTTGANSGLYAVVVTSDGCTSTWSNMEMITVIDPNNGMQAVNTTTADEPACVGSMVELSLPIIAGATYQWFGPAGFTSNLPNPALDNVTTSMAGNYFAIINFNNCNSVSNQTVVYIQDKPTPIVLESNSPLCEGETLVFDFENNPAPASNTFYFIYDENGILIADSLQNSTFNYPEVSLFDVGNYTAIVSIGGCESEPSNMALVEVDPIPTNIAIAGAGQVLCNSETAVELNAVMPSIGEGMWTSSTGAHIVNPDNANTFSVDIQTGSNFFEWSISNGACENYSSDTIEVFLESLMTNDDEIILEGTDSLINFDLFENDNLILFNGENWSLVSFPRMGEITTDENGLISYYPLPGVLGDDEFEYQVCSESCENLCDTSLITIILDNSNAAFDPSFCYIPNTITPDGDGINDALTIPCATHFEGSQLEIFNRWGDLIFQTDNYQNDWFGTYDNRPAPVGTYFYHLVLNDAEKTRHQGYVVIQR